MYLSEKKWWGARKSQDLIWVRLNWNDDLSQIREIWSLFSNVIYWIQHNLKILIITIHLIISFRIYYFLLYNQLSLLFCYLQSFPFQKYPFFPQALSELDFLFSIFYIFESESRLFCELQKRNQCLKILFVLLGHFFENRNARFKIYIKKAFLTDFQQMFSEKNSF